MTRMAFETLETVENLQLQFIELQKTVRIQSGLIMEQQKELEALKNRVSRKKIK